MIKPSDLDKIILANTIQCDDITLDVDIEHIKSKINTSVFNINNIIGYIEDRVGGSALYDIFESELRYEHLSIEQVSENLEDRIISICNYVEKEIKNKNKITIYRSTDGWEDIDDETIVSFANDEAESMGFYWTPSYETAENYLGNGSYLLEAELDTSLIDLEQTACKMIVFNEDEVFFNTEKPYATLINIYKDDFFKRTNNEEIVKLNSEPINKKLRLVNPEYDEW